MTSSQVVSFPHPREAAKVPVSTAKIAKIPTFAPGDKQDVTEVQNYLKHFGFMPLTTSEPTSTAGVETTAAIKAFQEFHSLDVDGTFGPQTRDAMSVARCGFPDLVQSVDFSVSGPWTRKNLKYAFGKVTAQISGDVAKAAVRRALSTWANAGVGLQFTEVATNQSPDFVIEWRPANDPDHSMVGSILAHADFPPGFSVVVNSLPLPLHYDDTEHKWVDGAVANSFDIETIGLHELGHILGLYHSSIVGSVMYPSVSANLTKRSLTADDQNAIRNLYPVWRSLGGSYTGLPCVLSWAEGRTDVFVRGVDNHVYHKWQNGGGTTWGPGEDKWEDLQGVIISNPTGCSWGPNRLDVFALGTDNACWHKWWDGSSWGGWESLGGGIIGDISAVSWGPNRIDLFCRGMDNGVYHKAWDGGAWRPSKTGWESLGGKILGSPKAVSWGPNRLDIFVRGLGNGVHQKTWNGSTWLPSVTGWQDLGGTIVDDITPVSWGPNRLDLFVVGTGNAVHHKAWDGGAWRPGPTAWEGIGGTIMSSPSVSAWGGNRLTIAAQGTDNGTWVKEWNGSTWIDWKSIGGVITDAPVVDPRGGDRSAVYVRGTNGAFFAYD
ncbi:carbohydrate-binding protein [Xylariales sp. PMI_506]|nr:carbohydrate-binding protein [Xylariales sp. PMI_506]